MKKSSNLSFSQITTKRQKCPSSFKKMIKKSIQGVKKWIGKTIRKFRGDEILITENEIFFRGFPLRDFRSDKKFVRRVA